MRKEDISYAVIGIVAGLVIGFLVANWTTTTTSAGPQAANTGEPKQASVNSSSSPQGLPPGHPPIEGSEPRQAPPLESGNESTTSGEVTELPSLDPLPAGSREKRTEQEYKNIQILKGLPAERLESIMFAFKYALGVECTHCHIKDQWEKDDKTTKQLARKMITMTRTVNNQLGGAARVSCFTCHQGKTRPPS